jgi:hypothetical protein
MRHRYVGGSIAKSSKGKTTLEVTNGDFESYAAKQNVWIGKKNGTTEHIYKSKEAESGKKQKETCSYTPPSGPKGSCSYYVWRFTNFMQRHPECKHRPPVYYYGPLTELGKLDPSEEFFIRLSSNPYHLSFTGQSDGQKAVKEAQSKRESDDNKSPHKYKRDKKTLVPRPDQSYGYKYCTKFTNELMPKLTPQGQNWLKKAKDDLQTYMEQGVVNKSYVSMLSESYNIENGLTDKNAKVTKKTKKVVQKFYTNIELNNSRFQNFAFATHPDAYNPVVMGKLPAHDLIRIMLTPDIQEWFGSETWEQAWTMAKNLNYKTITEATWEQLKNDTEEIIRKNGNKLKKYWDEIF